MADATAAGYQDPRDYAEANWAYLAFLDGGGTEVMRLGTVDARVSWTHATGANPIRNGGG